MGTVFWMTIIYSLLGYCLFLLFSVFLAKRIKGEVGDGEMTLWANLTVFLIVISGPLSWGMMIRDTLRMKESDAL